MSPGRAEAHAEDARSALTRRLARSYLRPDIAPSHRACAVHSRESTSVPSRLSSAAPPLSAEPTGLNPPTPVSGEPDYWVTGDSEVDLGVAVGVGVVLFEVEVALVVEDAVEHEGRVAVGALDRAAVASSVAKRITPPRAT